jgi:uncharacterized membrane protein
MTLGAVLAGVSFYGIVIFALVGVISMFVGMLYEPYMYIKERKEKRTCTQKKP